MAARKAEPRSVPSSIDAVRDEAMKCRRCDLWKRATQTVFGRGDPHAPIMLVGEQPGDAEDVEGVPFVGPAGQLLRAALEEAGIDIAHVYLTNAVKHFKWTPRGKRRIHEKPNREEILACRVWLDSEIALVRPRAIVALGATAAGVILGPSARVMRDRGKLFPSDLADIVTLTVHPSSILRAPDSEARAAARAQFVSDLRTLAKRLAGHERGASTGKVTRKVVP
jgi:uracil-DNA glycosylase